MDVLTNDLLVISSNSHLDKSFDKFQARTRIARTALVVSGIDNEKYNFDICRRIVTRQSLEVIRIFSFIHVNIKDTSSRLFV